MRPEELLHDAQVLEIRLAIGDHGTRWLSIRMCCDSDCGDPAWSNRVIDVRFENPTIIMGELFGHMANAESFDAWIESPNINLYEQLRRHEQVGLAVPRHLIRLILHSGSILDLACDSFHFVME